MSLREHQLHAKQQALIARSALLRQTITDDFNNLAPALHIVGQTSDLARRYVPWIIGIGLGLLVWKKPRSVTATGRKLLSAWQYAAPLQPWLISALTRAGRPVADRESAKDY